MDERRPERRTERRTERRPERRTDSRYDNRSDRRTDSRYDNRSDRRTDSRYDNRSDRRTDSRSEYRRDGRSDERPDRRRKLTPAEQRALDRQRKTQSSVEKKKIKQEAKLREAERLRRIKNGENPHGVVEFPAQPERSVPNKKKQSTKKKTAVKKKRKKTTPDIIKSETNKRVRKMSPKDYDDGYYINEVEVRRAQAKEQRRKRKESMPRELTPKQRKLRQTFAYVSICVVAVVVAVVLSLTVFFKTEIIEVKGNEIYNDSEIIQLAEVSKGHNIFVATMFGNTDAIKDELPYVKEARISFEIPEKLIINIEMETKFAALISEGNIYIINESGKILEKVDEVPKGLTKLKTGPLKKAELGKRVELTNKKATNAVFNIIECLRANNYKDITCIDVEQMAQISITYDSRILIKIGLPQDIDYKIRTAFTIINQKLDPNNTGKIKGVLDVSECNDTKKSYFNEGDIKEDVTNPTIVTQETTVSETVRSTFVTIPEETSSEGDIVGEDTEMTTEAVE